MSKDVDLEHEMYFLVSILDLDSANYANYKIFSNFIKIKPQSDYFFFVAADDVSFNSIFIDYT